MPFGGQLIPCQHNYLYPFGIVFANLGTEKSKALLLFYVFQAVIIPHPSVVEQAFQDVSLVY